MRKITQSRYLPIAGFVFCFIVNFPLKAVAHEFWIEPHNFMIKPDDALVADIKVGQMLKGRKQFFLPEKFVSFDLTQENERRAVKSSAGDLPAINEIDLKDGLAILSYASTNRKLHYDDPQTFQNFLEYEGIEWVKEAHTKRALPGTNFKEIYQRYAKSLIKVGAGKGQDQTLGLPLELVLESNPYTTEDDIPVKLLWQDKAFSDSQISVFFRPAGDETTDEVQRTLLTSDQDGIAIIPRPQQPGMLMLNAVHMVKPNAQASKETGAVWLSIWASTTFYIE